jgi:hypothetical protein
MADFCVELPNFLSASSMLTMTDMCEDLEDELLLASRQKA